MLIAPTRHSPIQHIKNKSSWCHCGGGIEIHELLFHRKQHSEKDPRHAATRITKGQKICEVKPPQHGEVFGFSGHSSF